MRGRHAGVIVAAFALSLTAPGLVQAQERAIRHRINVDAQDEDLTKLMAEIGAMAGQNIMVDEGVEERVSIRLYDISWRDAVDVIARQTRCKIKELPGGVLLLTQPPRVSIQLHEASVRTALVLLARYAHASIVIAPQVRGRISLSLHDVDWNRALFAVAQTAGDYTVVRDGDLVTIGGQGGSRQEAEGAPVLAGQFLVREAEQVRLRLESGEEVVCRLPDQPRLRKLLLGVLSRLRPGDRVVFSYAGQPGAELTLTNLVAPSR